MKNEKLYCTKTNNLFFMTFGFSYPVSRYSRVDTRTKEHGNPRKKVKDD